MYNNNIRELRKQKNMNLDELAREIGISTGYLCHLEKGTRSNPSTQIMARISKILEKSIEEIFFKENNDV